MEFEVTVTDKGVWITRGKGKRKTMTQVVRFDAIPGGGQIKVVTEEGAKVIEEMASEGSVLDEIAAILCISHATLYTPHNRERVKAAYEKGRAMCNDRLRHVQVSKAIEGDPRMLMFLGKVLLGQREQDAGPSSELGEFVKAIQGVKGDPEEE